MTLKEPDRPSDTGVMSWSPRRPEQSAPPTPPSTTRACPKCAEQVLASAQVCRYCNHEFIRQRRWYDQWKWALALLGVLVGLAYFTGGLDASLAGVGLNTRTCAENLFGNKMCGDELVQFCKDNYHPGTNSDTCDSVLADEGIDPQTVASEQKAKERRYQRCIDRAVTNDGSVADCDLP